MFSLNLHGLNLWKRKKGKTVLNAFIEIVNKSNRKTNRLRVDQRREFYNKLVQEWLGNNDILIFLTHNEGKSIIAERFIKTLKAKIYKKMAASDSKSYLSYLNIFSKGYTKNWSREIFIIDFVLKTNPWTYEIKDLNGEKMIGSFYEKELLLSIL